MGRPPKSVYLLEGHRTKAEKENREKQESALLTGEGMTMNKAVS